MACDLTLIRDEVYLRIGVKKAAGGFTTSNSFTLEKTWKPYTALEDLANPDIHPFGKVYVLGGRLGDLIRRSRQETSIAGPREYGVQLGFQIEPTSVADDAEMDRYMSMVQELERVCYAETNLHPFNFTRIEYAVTPDGLPLDFIMMRKVLTFESYFTAYFTKVLQ